MKKGLFFGSLLCAVMFLFSNSLRAESFTPSPLSGEIKIDGKLDEASWKTARPSSPFIWLPSANETKAPAKTEFRMLVSPDAIYLGISCAEREMGKLLAITK
ncbi:MAG: hypothetical protein NTY10_03330 [Candidatus Omnitrophica bacterium]|nr:hypothetical protein [Candidatus Omnitrophota bacterium]